MTASKDSDPLAHMALSVPNGLRNLPPPAPDGWVVAPSRQRRTVKAYPKGHAYNKPLEGVVLHYTASGSLESALTVLTETMHNGVRYDASAHFCVGRDGSVWQLVSIEERSKHAGNGAFGGQHNANMNTIGIEIVNWGWVGKEPDGKWHAWPGTVVPDSEVVESSQGFIDEAAKRSKLSSDARKRKGWQRYPDVQIAALDALLTQLEACGVPMVLTGHQDIATKDDPGPAFPWAKVLTGSRKKSP